MGSGGDGDGTSGNMLFINELVQILTEMCVYNLKKICLSIILVLFF